MAHHYKTALKNRMYLEIREECRRRLDKDGRFSTEAVLKATGHELSASSIYWKYVERMIGDIYDIDIIAVNKDFFRHKDENGELIQSLIAKVPERFVVGPSGKGGAGYVMVDPRNDALITCRLNHDNGAVKKQVEKISKTTKRTESYGASVTSPNFTPASITFPDNGEESGSSAT